MELSPFVANQIWLCSYPVYLAGMRFDARMTVIRLRSGKLMLHSPCEMTPEIVAQISALGHVAHIVAPGNYHTAHIVSAQRAFPDAKTWICPGIETRRPEIRYDSILSDAVPEAWADEIDQVVLAGSRLMREVAFHHREARTLILVDLIEYFTDATPHIGGGMKFVFKLLGMWNRPRMAPEYHMVWRDRDAAAESLRRILAWDFDQIVLSHGEIVRADAKASAQEAWAALLKRRG